MILSGDKTVELRNRVVRLKPGTSIWIYATQPLGSIVATAKVRKIVHGSPDEIWDRFEDEICIGKTHFDYYLKDRECVSAVRLYSVKKLHNSIALETIREVVKDFQPPQFYAYVLPDNDLFDTLNRLTIDRAKRG